MSAPAQIDDYAGASLGLVRRVAASLLTRAPGTVGIKGKRLHAALDASYLSPVRRRFKGDLDALAPGATNESHRA